LKMAMNVHTKRAQLTHPQACARLTLRSTTPAHLTDGVGC
jgi:hypothetical protein